MYIFACVYMNTEKREEENRPAITANAGRFTAGKKKSYLHLQIEAFQI